MGPRLRDNVMEFGVAPVGPSLAQAPPRPQCSSSALRSLVRGSRRFSRAMRCCVQSGCSADGPVAFRSRMGNLGVPRQRDGQATAVLQPPPPP